MREPAQPAATDLTEDHHAMLLGVTLGVMLLEVMLLVDTTAGEKQWPPRDLTEGHHAFQ